MRSYEEALEIAEAWGKPPFDNDTITSVKALLSLPEAERKKAIMTSSATTSVSALQACVPSWIPALRASTHTRLRA